MRDHASIAPGAEITIEANPDDVNDLAVAKWVGAGVNRVSLGSQSFDDGVSSGCTVRNDARKIGEAVRTLRRGGSLTSHWDLIFALPASLNLSWERD